MSAKHGPSILFVYFTYTKQTLKVVEAMSEVLEPARGFAGALADRLPQEATTASAREAT